MEQLIDVSSVIVGWLDVSGVPGCELQLPDGHRGFLHGLSYETMVSGHGAQLSRGHSTGGAAIIDLSELPEHEYELVGGITPVLSGLSLESGYAEGVS